ncbi:hypothetical protein B0H13DRAFT_1903708 [Mycena leptocephala]|nr:hypothetical protein B0H13DRAFT_1903708 [Mycena leptocephala]
MVQQICNCSAEIHVGAKICEVVRTLRPPLISDGVEEQALLRGVEDGSPTRAVAKSLRCDGVSGRNAHRRECHTRTTVMKALYWMSARAAGDPADSLRRRDDRGSGRRERLNMPRDVQHQMNCRTLIAVVVVAVVVLAGSRGEVVLRAADRSMGTSRSVGGERYRLRDLSSSHLTACSVEWGKGSAGASRHLGAYRTGLPREDNQKQPRTSPPGLPNQREAAAFPKILFRGNLVERNDQSLESIHEKRVCAVYTHHVQGVILSQKYQEIRVFSELPSLQF